MSTPVTKDIDFDMEELVDFDDAVTTTLKESGIAAIAKADVEVKEEKVKGDVRVVEEPKSILTTLSQEAQAQLNFERAKAVAGGCSECGRPQSISRCLWIKDCINSGLLVKQVKLGRKFPIYNDRSTSRATGRSSTAFTIQRKLIPVVGHYTRQKRATRSKLMGLRTSSLIGDQEILASADQNSNPPLTTWQTDSSDS